MKHILTPLSAIFLAVFLIASPVLAHEGHQKDMTDAEMAQMEADMAQMHPAEGGAPHDAISSHETMQMGGDAHGEPGSASTTVPVTAEEALAAKIAENRLTSASDFLGRLHPMVAHFPIALLLFAALAELALFFRPALGLETTVRFLVAGGAIGAVGAAVFGWFAAGWRLSDRSETLGLHRWNGTAIALVSLLAWWLTARGKGRGGLRAVLALIVVGLITQGYLGGEMVFGPNHMGIQ